jgi:hypothetical protein
MPYAAGIRFLRSCSIETTTFSSTRLVRVAEFQLRQYAYIHL